MIPFKIRLPISTATNICVTAEYRSWHTLLLIPIITIILLVTPSGAAFAAGGACDEDEDGSVDLGDLLTCERQVLGFDTDGDGFRPGEDCNDSKSNVYPGATELCDGMDNDCDGQVDKDFSNFGEICSTGVGACSSLGYRVCAAGGDSLECNATLGSPTGEVCDGIDNDCDGITDNNLTLELCSLQVGVCAGSTQTCLGISGIACDTSLISDYQFMETSCDGLDNDCDAQVDEGCP